MKKIRISKHHRSASRLLDPLPLDPRDLDIVHAKQLARRSRPPGTPAASSGRTPSC